MSYAPTRTTTRPTSRPGMRHPTRPGVRPATPPTTPPIRPPHEPPPAPAERVRPRVPRRKRGRRALLNATPPLVYAAPPHVPAAPAAPTPYEQGNPLAMLEARIYTMLRESEARQVESVEALTDEVRAMGEEFERKYASRDVLAQRFARTDETLERHEHDLSTLRGVLTQWQGILPQLPTTSALEEVITRTVKGTLAGYSTTLDTEHMIEQRTGKYLDENKLATLLAAHREERWKRLQTSWSTWAFIISALAAVVSIWAALHR